MGFTPVPNEVFDEVLPSLKPAELLVLLVIIRQTKGWKGTRPNTRKERDWISISQFQHKTGLSRKSISTAIGSLSKRGLVGIFNLEGKELLASHDRKRAAKLYFSYCGKQKEMTWKRSVISSSGERKNYALQKEILQKKFTQWKHQGNSKYKTFV